MAGTLNAGAARVSDQGRTAAAEDAPASTAGWLSAGSAAGFDSGTVRVVTTGDDLRIAICNLDGEFYAIEDVCTHDGGPLDQGELEDGQIECPRHGARFDVRTGAVTQMPAAMPVRTFPVNVVDGEVLVGTTPGAPLGPGGARGGALL